MRGLMRMFNTNVVFNSDMLEEENLIQNFGDLYRHHQVSRDKIYPGYNPRTLVPDNLVNWNVRSSEYSPMYAFDEDQHLSPPYWVAPSFEAKYKIFQDGFPLNPIGRTGLKGRGKFSYFGPNHVANVLALREMKNEHEVLVIKKSGSSWALPGGFVGRRERNQDAAFRKFTEEALGGIGKLHQLSNQPLKLVYQGYADDPRNTDNAWAETSAYLLFLKRGLNNKIFRAGDDIEDLKWISIYSPEAKALYGGHSAILEVAVENPVTYKSWR